MRNKATTVGAGMIVLAGLFVQQVPAQAAAPAWTAPIVRTGGDDPGGGDHPSGGDSTGCGSDSASGVAGRQLVAAGVLEDAVRAYDRAEARGFPKRWKVWKIGNRLWNSGGLYHNYNLQLPHGPGNYQPDYYEYDMHLRCKGRPRNSFRIVIDLSHWVRRKNAYRTWYTKDHYASFSPLY
jgi:hypothetical protein